MKYTFKNYDEAARAIGIFNRMYPSGYAYLTNENVSIPSQFTLVIEYTHG